jgi:hypothetical protein
MDQFTASGLQAMQWRLQALERVRDNPYWGPEHRVGLDGEIALVQTKVAELAKRP